MHQDGYSYTDHETKTALTSAACKTTVGARLPSPIVIVNVFGVTSVCVISL